MKFINLLGFRLILGIAVIVLAGMAFFATLLVDWQADKYLASAKISAVNISDLISRSTRYSMLLNRREDIYQIIKTIGHEPRIEGIRIYNKKGAISFSTRESEVGSYVDMTAEACNGCHGAGKPRAARSDSILTRVFNSRKGYRVIGVITPIRNEESCSSSDCHAHESSQTVLGILDVLIPLKEVDENIALFRRTQVIGAIILALALSGFAALYIWRMVHVPVRKLTAGTDEIIKGNLDHKIDIRSKNEIGGLAASFNQMTQELKRARKELTNWNQMLEKKVAEKTEELRLAQDHMVQMEKMVSLGTLAATVAHELNNPLEGILTYAKLIRKKLELGELSGESLTEILGELSMIADETARCGNIVKNLLLFSREKIGEFKENDLRALVDRTFRLIEHHLKMHAIRVVSNFEDRPLLIVCDAHQIEEALLALEINAVEAMPSGGTLTIDVGEMPGRNAVHIEVSDTGVGIPNVAMPHIFEPFYTTKKDGKGTGLGLSVVYGIIERHGGSISVDSKVDTGTTFTITLPKQFTPKEATL
jgi:two-component system NtrC family sensor kinase